MTELRNRIETVISQLETDPDRLRANWSMPRESARLLYLMARIGQVERALEVGTSIGYSGLHLGLALAETGGQLDTIDASPERLSQARQHFEAAGLSDVIRIHQGDALPTLTKLPGKAYDLMFIDARKSEYLDYFHHARRLLRPGGVLFADNTRSHRGEMADFIEAVTQHPDWETADLDTPNGFLLARQH